MTSQRAAYLRRATPRLTAKSRPRGIITLHNSYNAEDLAKLQARMGNGYEFKLATPRDYYDYHTWRWLFRG